MFDFYVLASFVGYLALMLGIGFFFSRKQEDLGDYYLGGRRMNKWVVALSAQASDMSGWLLMGLPGAVSGMVVGAVTCFVWKFVLSDYAGTHEIFGLYELAPGFLFAFVTTVIVSLVTQKPSAETLIEFDKVKEAL